MRDLLFAIRALRKSPGFVLITSLSLAIALVPCNTTFAVLDAVVNPTMPVFDPENLLVVGNAGDRAARNITAYHRVLRVTNSAAFHEENGNGVELLAALVGSLIACSVPAVNVPLETLQAT